MTPGDRNGARGARPAGAQARPTDDEVWEAMQAFEHRTSDVAEYYGVARQTVWKWTQRPEYKAVERRHRVEVRKRIAKAYAEDMDLAFRTARHIAETSEDDHASLNAARFLVGEHRALEKDERELEALEAGMQVDEHEGESIAERIRKRAAMDDFPMVRKPEVAPSSEGPN